MNKKTTISAGVALLIVCIILLFIFKGSFGGGEQFKLLKEDAPITWELTPLSGITQEDLKKKIDAYNEELEGTPAEKKEDRYNLYVNIAMQYENSGDGEKAFEYLNKAVSEWPERSIAYMNMGTLLEKAGAKNSARAAYEMAILKEPQFPFLHLALTRFLINSSAPEEDTEDAFKAGLSATEEDANILREYATWKEDSEKSLEAIALWEQVLVKDTANAQVIREHINDLKK